MNVGPTALMIYRTQQNQEVVEIPISVHLKQENKQETEMDALLHFSHVSLPNAKQKMEITFVS